jgi:phosphatidylserine/phosphatidylglycerophosphate/cardiolipin synthase-like enzyme
MATHRQSTAKREEAGISLSIGANRLRVIENGPALREALIGLIDGATDSLKLYYYIFADDESGRMVLDRLVAARGRGVAVTLMIDAFGSADTPAAFFAQGGRSFRAFRRAPIDALPDPQPSEDDHRRRPAAAAGRLQCRGCLFRIAGG